MNKMKRSEKIQTEVEKTLGALDNWTPVKTDAFFYTRLLAKIEKRSSPSKLNWLFESPILKPALIAAALILNLLSIGYIIASNKSIQDQTSDFSTEFTNEYFLNQSTESYLVFNDE